MANEAGIVTRDAFTRRNPFGVCGGTRGRGLEAFEAIGLLVGFLGRRVHDSWAPYLSLPGLYALCNAHLLRELIGRFEDTQQAWLQALIRLMLKMQTAVTTAKAAGWTELPP